MPQHKLVDIPASEWCNLQEKYLANWPRHMLGYYTIDNFIKWQKIDSNIKNLNCYCLDGDWSDGTFVFIVSLSVHFSIIIFMMPHCYYNILYSNRTDINYSSIRLPIRMTE